MTLKSVFATLKQNFFDWNEDDAPRMGAALAFYTLVSISPLMILVVGIVSVVFNRSSAQSHLLFQVQSLNDPEGKNAVEAMLKSGGKAASGIVASTIGILTLVFGASGVFTELRSHSTPSGKQNLRRVREFGGCCASGFSHSAWL